MLKNLTGWLWGRDPSKWEAKNRLQMVLVQDRSGLTTCDMDQFQKDILEVISRYFVVEPNSLSVEWQRQDESTALIINTPVVGRPKVEKAA